MPSEKRYFKHLLWQRGERHCFYCGVKFPRAKVATLDHKHPQALGGRTTFDNVVLACDPCNNKKGCMTAEQFQLTVGVVSK